MLASPTLFYFFTNTDAKHSSTSQCSHGGAHGATGRCGVHGCAVKVACRNVEPLLLRTQVVPLPLQPDLLLHQVTLLPLQRVPALLEHGPPLRVVLLQPRNLRVARPQLIQLTLQLLLAALVVDGFVLQAAQGTVDLVLLHLVPAAEVHAVDRVRVQPAPRPPLVRRDALVPVVVRLVEQLVVRHLGKVDVHVLEPLRQLRVRQVPAARRVEVREHRVDLVLEGDVGTLLAHPPVAAHGAHGVGAGVRGGGGHGVLGGARVAGGGGGRGVGGGRRACRRHLHLHVAHGGAGGVTEGVDLAAVAQLAAAEQVDPLLVQVVVDLHAGGDEALAAVARRHHLHLGGEDVFYAALQLGDCGHAGERDLEVRLLP
eukprot:Rhum_TRINITY_DN3737_c0_g1::Rhum_TRINITY_DN3737_c0_g1_i1::g.11757::m.11757